MAEPAATPRPSVTPVDPGTLIGKVIAPAGTTWSGTDSAGDSSTFTLKKDHSTTVKYNANTFNYSGDTWAVSAGVLRFHVYIDGTNGQLDYTGTFDPATKTIAATGTASASGKIVTVALTQK
jgi:hypothetical protein